VIAKRFLALVPAVVAAGVGLTGCDQATWVQQAAGGSGAAGSDSAPPTDAAGLARYLRDGTADISSAHLTLDVNSGGVEITADGDEKLAGGQLSALDLTETIPGAGDITVLIVDGSTYAKVPAALQASDKPWLLISPDSSNPLVQQLAASLGSVEQSSSLDQYATFTQAATITGQDSEQLDGVDTTHYQLQVDVTQLPNDLPGRSDLLSAGLTTLPLELWVDSSGRPVKITENFTVQGTAVSTVVTLGAFDAPVTITAPPAGQVDSD
jgi:hypothetical protein